MVNSYFRSRSKSFSFAWKGITRIIKTEPNARIHLSMTVLVIALAAFLHVNLTEWTVLVILIAMVFTAEFFNTALEQLADAAVPEQNEKIKLAKDYAAGAVLMAALGSVVAGLIIFLPKLFALIS